MGMIKENNNFLGEQFLFNLVAFLVKNQKLWLIWEEINRDYAYIQLAVMEMDLKVGMDLRVEMDLIVEMYLEMELINRI